MSYTELKTINGDSIKGTGNLVVTGGGVSDGDYGDITVSSSGTVWNIDAATVGVTELSATGTPSATTFLRGDNTWATPNNNPEGWTTIIKSANQDVTNSATLVTDTDLQFSVVAGGHYMIKCDLTVSGFSTTADYKFAFNVSSGTMTGKGHSQSINAAGAIQNLIVSANGASTASLVVGASAAALDDLTAVSVAFSFTASANATFRFQFANNTATPGAASRTWKGSILKYKRLD